MVSNYIVNLIKREKRYSFVGVMFHARQDKLLVPPSQTISPSPTIHAHQRANIHTNKKFQSRIQNLTILIVTKAPYATNLATNLKPIYTGMPSLFARAFALTLISLQSSFLIFFCAVRIFTMPLRVAATAIKKAFLFAFICACSALSTIAFACATSSSCL